MNSLPFFRVKPIVCRRVLCLFLNVSFFLLVTRRRQLGKTFLSSKGERSIPSRSSSQPSRTNRTLLPVSWIWSKKTFCISSEVSSGRNSELIASLMSEFSRSRHFNFSNTSTSAMDPTLLPTAQSYVNFWQNMVLPIAGSPSNKTDRGCLRSLNSSCDWNISGILTTLSVTW